MPDIFVAGVDVGFIKTGMTVFRLGQRTDTLVYAETLESEFEKSHIPGQSAEDDVRAVLRILVKIDRILSKYHISGAFVEIPHGGAQSSRAARCMGIATGWITALMYYRENVGYEFYNPIEVEKTLGIHLLPSQAKNLGLKKGESTKYKKERIKGLVESTFPKFRGWPAKAALAEDSYDSAAAFLCGRTKNQLYKRLKRLVGAPDGRYETYPPRSLTEERGGGNATAGCSPTPTERLQPTGTGRSANGGGTNDRPQTGNAESPQGV